MTVEPLSLAYSLTRSGSSCSPHRDGAGARREWSVPAANISKSWFVHLHGTLLPLAVLLASSFFRLRGLARAALPAGRTV